MTDKQKLDAIKAEIHRLVDVRGYDREMANDLLAFMNSLPNEPVSEDEIEKQFKVGDVVVYVSRQPAYSGFYILGNANDLSIGYSNCNEPFQIALRNCTIASEAEYSQFFRELNLNGYKWNNDTLRIEKIEPVSEDLKEASRNYADNEEYGDDVYFAIKAAFEAGAKWQFEEINKVLLSKVLPCFMHGGEADEVVAKLDEVLNQKK